MQRATRERRTPRSTFSLLATLALIALAIPQPASAENVGNFHHPAEFAELLASTCPWTPPFPYEVECSDILVRYQHGAVNLPHLGDSSMPLHENTWDLYVQDVHYILHPGTTPEEPEWEFVSERKGFVQDVPGYVDTVHLLRANVGADVPMSDGSMVSLALQWDLTGQKLNTSGNDGPIQEEGIPWGTHGGDRCFTGNYLAHQTWRSGGGASAVSGSVDGVNVATLFMPSDHPSIGRGVFTIIETEHGGCA